MFTVPPFVTLRLERFSASASATAQRPSVCVAVRLHFASLQTTERGVESVAISSNISNNTSSVAPENSKNTGTGWLDDSRRAVDVLALARSSDHTENCFEFFSESKTEQVDNGNMTSTTTTTTTTYHIIPCTSFSQAALSNVSVTHARCRLAAVSLQLGSCLLQRLARFACYQTRPRAPVLSVCHLLPAPVDPLVSQLQRMRHYRPHHLQLPSLLFNFKFNPHRCILCFSPLFRLFQLCDFSIFG